MIPPAPLSLREQIEQLQQEHDTLAESACKKSDYTTMEWHRGFRSACEWVLALLAEVAAQTNAPVEIIVNGQPVEVAAGPIREVIAEAIRAAGQIGAPIEQWVLRTRDGEVIPHHLPDGLDYALVGGQRFFLHLGLPVLVEVPAPLKNEEEMPREGSRGESRTQITEQSELPRPPTGDVPPTAPEPDDDFQDYDIFASEGCQRCGGEGIIVVCVDDMCRGAGECMHGDGEIACPNCGGI